MPRPKHCRFVSKHRDEYAETCTKKIVIHSDELEALRLNAIESLHQEKAAKMMGVSRATYGRILKSCLKKVALALVSGHEIIVSDVPWVVSEKVSKEKKMNKIIALPVMNNDENTEVSAHFGHAPFFAIVSDKDISFIENHHGGGCGDVVQVLKNKDVDVLLVKGIGGRPKIICDQLGIEVYRAYGNTISECVKAWGEGSNETDVSCNHKSEDHKNCNH